MGTPEIRPATRAEADTLVDQWVTLAAGQREYDSHIKAEENRTHIRESIIRHIVNETILVADADDDIVGFVMFAVEHGRYEQDSTRGFIENLYVRDDRRRERIGSRLLERAEQRLTERDVDTIALEVMAGNELAREFYRARGFTPHRLEFERSVESDTHSKGDE